MGFRGEHWRDSIGLLIASLLIIGPFALPLLWLNRKVKPMVKILSTVAIVFISIWSYNMMISLTETLKEAGPGLLGS